MVLQKIQLPDYLSEYLPEERRSQALTHHDSSLEQNFREQPFVIEHSQEDASREGRSSPTRNASSGNSSQGVLPGNTDSLRILRANGNSVQSLEHAIQQFTGTQKEFDAWLRERNSPFYAAYIQAKRLVNKAMGTVKREVKLQELFDRQVLNLEQIEQCLGYMIQSATPTFHEVRAITGGLIDENESLTTFLERTAPALREAEQRYGFVTHHVQGIQQQKPDSPEFYRGLRTLLETERVYDGLRYQRALVETRYQYSKGELARSWAYEKIMGAVLTCTASVQITVDSLRKDLYIRGRAIPTIMELTQGNSRVLGLVSQATHAAIEIEHQLAQGLENMGQQMQQVQQCMGSLPNHAIIQDVVGYLRTVR